MRIQHLSRMGLVASLTLVFVVGFSAFDHVQSAGRPGLYVLLEVELDQAMKDRADSTAGDIRHAFRRDHIGYADLAVTDTGVSVRIIDSSRFAQAAEWIRVLNPEMNDSVPPARQYNITQPGDGRIVLTMTDGFKRRIKQNIVSTSIDVIRKRIDGLGGKHFSVKQQGEDRIVVRVHNSQHNSEIPKLFQPPPKLTFQLVDETGDVSAAQRGNVPPGDDLLEQENDNEIVKPPLLVEKRVLVDGERLRNASWAINQDTGQVVLTFRFDDTGASQFADATKANLGRRFAVVLDKKVITAPVIREPILGGSGEIEGNFTTQTANDLAARFRTSALPAPFHVLEVREIQQAETSN